MKQLASLLFLAVIFGSNANAQSKLNWFITPESGAMFLEEEVGLTSGISAGFYVWKSRVKLGIHNFSRPGPINRQTYTVEASDGQVYKGSSTLTLRADHGAFGVYIAPTFHTDRWEIDLPVSMGQMGAGFYFTGEDRETPDGDRVSVWEDRLMDGRDAGFGTYVDFGIRAIRDTRNPAVKAGFGIHFMTTQGWETYFDPTGEFYNNTLRASVFMHFGQSR